jgi:hypothetical protein
VQAQIRVPDPRGKAELEGLLRNFASDTVLYRQLIRDQLDSDREAFLAHTIEILKGDTESRGIQYLMSLLVSENLLFEAICDPALSRPHALALARMAVRVDPMVDVALARRLAATALSDPDARSIGEAGRLMEVLEEISTGTRIMPCLMPLLRNANPYLRSKAVRMIGRGIRSVKWVQHRLNEGDARIRANAVEGLWDVDSAESRELLHFAARDGNNRVAGNALLGLYRLGDCSAIPELLKMSGHPSSLFRMSAAWAMGATADPRFSEALGGMLADPDGAVRKRAFAAVSQIKAASARIFAQPAWRVSGLVVRSGRALLPSARRIRVTVVSVDGREHPRLRPTHFILSEEGQPVWSYDVREKPLPEAMSVVFVFPRTTVPGSAPWNRAALECLGGKRRTDLWRFVTYAAAAPEGRGSADDAGPELPPFTSDAGLLEAALGNPARRSDCTDLWSTLGRIVRPENVSARGRQHFIVFAPAELERSPGWGLANAVRASHASLQVVCSSQHKALEALCAEAGGHFQAGDGDAEIEDLISRAYWNLFGRYEIIYQAVNPAAAGIRLRVHAPEGWGEASIAMRSAEPLGLQDHGPSTPMAAPHQA